MSTILSIVMPSLFGRMAKSTIAAQVHDQISHYRPRDRRARYRGNEIEFLELRDNGAASTGRKMNTLYKLCRGEYICGIGDDDRVADDYVSSLMNAITDEPGVDAVTFDHSYSVDGNFVATVKQSLDAEERGDGQVHYRTAGPLCPVKRSIAVAFSAPDTRDQEDVAYKDYLRSALKTSVNIPRVLYHHQWTGFNKTERKLLNKQWGGR